MSIAANVPKPFPSSSGAASLCAVHWQRHVRPSVHGKLHHSRNAHWNLEPSKYSSLGREGRAEEAIWNLVIGASLELGAWDLELPPASSRKEGTRIFPKTVFVSLKF